MTTAPSLARRALLAVVLLVGFYLLAIALAGVLLYIPWADWQYGGQIHARLAIFCIVGALIIVWSILPRFDRFKPPGPALERGRHPRLYGVLDRVASATDQQMPAEVYLAPDLNAWVAQRGGIMAIGSRRVMGLGLPLLQLLTTSQLAAVLAHEFGHYYGGDTRLGPWVYKTRSAIARTLMNLAEHSSLLMKPFEWYGNLFIRITHAVSRRQEYSADALAARTVGAEPLMEGLKTVHGASMAFDAYWNLEVAPALHTGYRPPLAQGFARYVKTPNISTAIDETLQAQLEHVESDPFDTHPPLKERIAALSAVSSGEVWQDESPAISLLEGVDQLEQQLLASIAGPDDAARLKPVAWDEVVRLVWIPAWQSRAEEYRGRFRGLTVGQLAELADEPSALAVKLGFAAEPRVTTDDHRAEAAGTLGTVLTAALLAGGWTVTALPGEPVVLTRGEQRIEPFDLWNQLVQRRLTPAEWRALCAEAGITGLDLGAERPPGR